MNNFSSIVIPPNMPLIDAMSVIDKGSRGIAFICEGEILRATLTDGDVRRHILRNGDLKSPVSQIGNHRFKYAKVGQSNKYFSDKSKEWSIKHIPILDDDGCLVAVYPFDDVHEEKPRISTPVVIMAGGKGVRLHPYTKILPKPLIPLGDLTITEHIIKSFAEYGCEDFSMIVNYKKNIIKAYFADNENISCRLTFFEEETPLGTGGGLSLLKDKINQTFFMTNCDILVFDDYAKILKSHLDSGNIITIVCSTKCFTVPYGTVEINDFGQLISISEKPSSVHLINTGLYIIEPSFLDRIPTRTFVDLPNLILDCIKNDIKVGIYPTGENQWYDMGQHDELKRMQEILT